MSINIFSYLPLLYPMIEFPSTLTALPILTCPQLILHDTHYIKSPMKLKYSTVVPIAYNSTCSYKNILVLCI